MPEYFTVDQANALIPRLTAILTEVKALRPRLADDQRQVGRLTNLPKRNGHALPPVALPALQAEAQQLALRLKELLDEIQALGGQIKDLELGLVDFPSRRHDRDILLCWRLGEDAIRFYHDLDSGFAGRQPL